MVDIVTRAGKGSPLTNNEVDANFTNLAEVSGITGEPMGHEDRTTSTISFNASTRTFTIAPVSTSFTVWCKGKKVVVSSAQTVTIPNTSGMYSIYYDANGVLAAKAGYFTFSVEAPTAYVYWNAATGTCPYFGDERHGVVLDWQTHEYLHRTRGAALASGFGASGYTLGGNGSSNAHAQLTLEGGTFFDEDMKIIVTATNTPTAGTWEQDLLSPARIPVLYLSGTGWVIDAPTDYPLKQGTARPQYNALSGGVWSTADVANNKYATSWILATNNLTYPVIAIIGQAESDLQSAAEAVDFTSLQLPGFPSVEFRPLYRLVFQCADSFSNAVKASLVSITDIRSIAAAGVAASLITDHGNLSGLSDDDHPQYLSVDTVRGTLTAAVKASFLPSQAGNAGKFLTTDATSTSWAALTSGNITTALGFTPYNATNPNGYITGITSSNVTTALGFTPYNATNPSGYVTAAGARGAISVTGAGSYDSATGVINIVGGVTSFNTRTGAITLSSADVTTALGFTPYNSTNPNGYLTGITSTQVTTALGYTPYNSSNPSGYITGITSGMVTTALGFTPYDNSNPSGYITNSALSGYLTSASAASTYLPLSGGTLSGAVTGTTFQGGGWGIHLNPSTAAIRGSGAYGGALALVDGSYGIALWSQVGVLHFGFGSNTAVTAKATMDASGNFNAAGAITQASNQVLHAGNYSSYALPLTGGTLSGTLGSARNDIQRILETYNTSAGSPTQFFIEHSYGSVNIGNARGNINISSGSLLHGGSQVLHAGNYGSYALPLAGGTLTGNRPIQFDTVGGSVIIKGDSGGWGMGLYFKGTDNVIKGSFGALGGGSSFSYLWAGIDYANTWMTFTSGQINSSVALTQGNNQVLHAGNYNSYALPLSGGNLSGDLQLLGNYLRFDQTGTRSWNMRATGGNLDLNSGDGNGSFRYNGGVILTSNTYTNYALPLTAPSAQTLRFDTTSTEHITFQNQTSGGAIQLGFQQNDTDGLHHRAYFKFYKGSAGGVAGAMDIIMRSVGGGTTTDILRLQAGSAPTWAGSTMLTAGNYSSYALPLSGGTVSGAVRINNQLQVGQNTNGTAIIDAFSGIARFGRDSTTKGLLLAGDNTATLTSDYGFLQLGPLNSSWCHFQTDRPNFYFDRSVYVNGDIYQYSNSALYLNSSNYSSYALPLSGGTLSGDLRVNTIRDTSGIWVLGKYGSEVSLGSAGAVNEIRFNSSAAAAFEYRGSAILHAGNVSSYALPIGGGTVSGRTTFADGLRIGPTPGDPYAYIITRTMPSGDPNAANEATELLLFHSNDPSNGAGPDYITLRAPAIRFQTYDNAAVADPDASGGWNNRLTISPAGAVNSVGALTQGGNQVLHAANINSYIPNWSFSVTGNHIVQRDGNGYIYANHINFNTGIENPTIDNFITGNGDGWSRKSSLAHVKNSIRGIADGTWGISVTGNAESATRLINLRTINGSGFDGTSNIDATEWFHSGRDFPSGTLITTNINYAVTYGDPFVLEIRGNSYGNIIPLDLQYQGYIYADTIINHGGLSNGLMIQGLVAINNGGNLCFWFPSQGYWNGYNVKVYAAYATRAVNRVTSITGTGKPTTAKEVALTASIRQSLHSDNFGNYALPLSGGTVTGTLNTNGRVSANNGTLFFGSFILGGSGASYDNSTGARMSENYGALWNFSNGATWHHQIINGSSLIGFTAAGGNFGNGNLVASGNVTAYYSDERLKTKVTTITNALDKVRSLEGFIYVENELAKSLGYTNSGEQAGVSAQRVKAVLPQAVSLAPVDMQGVPETGAIISKSGENYLTVDYSRLSPLLIEAIKEQDQEVIDLRTRVAHLESLINRLIGD